jgi:hypothetical protein
MEIQSIWCEESLLLPQVILQNPVLKQLRQHLHLNYHLWEALVLGLEDFQECLRWAECLE